MPSEIDSSTTTTRQTCFSIMPFAQGFRDIDRIVCEAAKQCGLEYVRGDLTGRSGSILSQILDEIHRAAVVVADITGHNPNVFYELGIAHQVKGPERVVIITQEVDGRKAYDVHQFRQLVYSHSADGRRKLRKELPDRLRDAAVSTANQEFWNVIRGGLPRTRMLVRDLQRLVEQEGSNALKDITIRIVAGLGSLAISDKESSDPNADPEYIDALLSERNILRAALLGGARLKGILNPPRRFAQSMRPERLRIRFERLIGLLDGRSDIPSDPKVARDDVAAVKQCAFVLSPVPMPNLFIIGDTVAYEGMKRAGRDGFDMTHCETNPHAVGALIHQFDRFFQETRTDMLRSHPPDGGLLEQLKTFYREAVSIGKKQSEGTDLPAAP